MSQQLQNTIETAWENRANLSPPLPPRKWWMLSSK